MRRRATIAFTHGGVGDYLLCCLIAASLFNVSRRTKVVAGPAAIGLIAISIVALVPRLMWDAFLASLPIVNKNLVATLTVIGGALVGAGINFLQKKKIKVNAPAATGFIVWVVVFVLKVVSPVFMHTGVQSIQPPWDWNLGYPFVVHQDHPIILPIITPQRSCGGNDLEACTQQELYDRSIKLADKIECERLRYRSRVDELRKDLERSNSDSRSQAEKQEAEKEAAFAAQSWLRMFLQKYHDTFMSDALKYRDAVIAKSLEPGLRDNSILREYQSPSTDIDVFKVSDDIRRLANTLKHDQTDDTKLVCDEGSRDR